MSRQTTFTQKATALFSAFNADAVLTDSCKPILTAHHVDDARCFKIIEQPSFLGGTCRPSMLLSEADQKRWHALAEGDMVYWMSFRIITNQRKPAGLVMRFMMATKQRLESTEVMTHKLCDEWADDAARRCMFAFQFSYHKLTNIVHIDARSVHPCIRGVGLMSTVSLAILTQVSRHLGPSLVLENTAMHKSTANFMACSEEDLTAIAAQVKPLLIDGGAQIDGGLQFSRPLTEVLSYQAKRVASRRIEPIEHVLEPALSGPPSDAWCSIS